MIREINRDIILLKKKCRPAEKKDLPIARDLKDTLVFHQKECVGMAANMIGEPVCIIAVMQFIMPVVMLNPVITAKKQPYDTEEGCLSLSGRRKTTRWQEITVRWQDMDFVLHQGTFSGYMAQIIQHECDHLNGIVI